MTPEGRIKAQVRRILEKYLPIDTFWPVPNGMGASHLDCICCYYGRYLSIETKAPGKKPTPRQKARIGSVQRAGGIAMVIDGAAGLQELEKVLVAIKAASNEMVQAANVRNSVIEEA